MVGMNEGRGFKMTGHIGARLDVSGVCCPLPLLALAKAIKDLESGQKLEVTGNDPIFESSVRDYCQANGHAVLDAKGGDHRSVIVLIEAGG